MDLSDLKQFGADIFFIVVILFAGLYQLMIYCLRRTERAYLYSAIFCVAAAVYTASLPPEPTLMTFFPGIGIYACYSVSLAASIVSNIYFVDYLYALYPSYFGSNMLKAIKLMAILCTVFIAGMNIFDYWQPLYPVYYFYLVFFLSLSLYLFVMLIRIQKDNRDALIVLGGFTALFASSVASIFFRSSESGMQLYL